MPKRRQKTKKVVMKKMMTTKMKTRMKMNRQGLIFPFHIVENIMINL